jgi:hypothetical protein
MITFLLSLPFECYLAAFIGFLVLLLIFAFALECD